MSICMYVCMHLYVFYGPHCEHAALERQHALLQGPAPGLTMHLYVCAHIYRCMHACSYVCMHTYKNACVCAYVQVCMFACMPHVCVHAYVYAHVCVCMHTCFNVCMHIYAYNTKTQR